MRRFRRFGLSRQVKRITVKALKFIITATVLTAAILFVGYGIGAVTAADIKDIGRYLSAIPEQTIHSLTNSVMPYFISVLKGAS